MWWSRMTGKLERAKQLDPVVEAVSGVASKVLPPGPVKDALHGRWLGHPLHPLMITLPIGLWSGALLLDFTGGSREAARRLVGTGVLAFVPTASAGWADWSELGAFHEPKRVGLVHAAANGFSAALFGASWLARRNGDDRRGRVLALFGAAGVTVGGYLGGHLSYSQGVGVNRNADADQSPADWADAAAVADLPADGLLRVEVDDQPIVLARSGGELYAMLATCTHYGGPLDQGQLVDGCVECPWHGSRFRLSDGSVARGPATAPETSYDVRTVGDRVEVRARR